MRSYEWTLTKLALNDDDLLLFFSGSKGAHVACFAGEPVKLRKNITLE
jgi:DNA primase catalytic subunit